MGAIKKRMKYLTYLIGPMEALEDEGLNWRLDYEKELNKLNIQCIIPNHYEKALKGMSGKEYQKLKTTDINTHRNIMRKIQFEDLSFVEQSDFVICKWDGEATAGTISEASHAVYREIPAYLVTQVPQERIMGWFLGSFDKVFSCKETLFKHLSEELK